MKIDRMNHQQWLAYWLNHPERRRYFTARTLAHMRRELDKLTRLHKNKDR